MKKPSSSQGYLLRKMHFGKIHIERDDSWASPHFFNENGSRCETEFCGVNWPTLESLVKKGFFDRTIDPTRGYVFTLTEAAHNFAEGRTK